MSKNQTDNIEALLALVDLAQQDIAEATSSFPEQGGESFGELCVGHLETIGWACEMAGLVQLSAIASALLARFESDKSTLNAAAGAELVNWLNDVPLYLASPADAELVSLLLTPLAADTRSELLQSWRAQGIDAGTESLQEGFPEEDLPEHLQADDLVVNGDIVCVEDSNEDLAFLDAGMLATRDAAEFDTSGMLGMLASELHDATPELGQLADTICAATDAATLQQAVTAYKDIVSRILTVADELKLEGLIQVCLFVIHNTTLLEGLAAADRLRAREVLREWPCVIIAHLVQPQDDALCLAVVDFLEIDSWPEALPYRQVRDLIDGLTSQLEISGVSMVEKREVDALAEDAALEMSGDVSAELI